ncbi:head decoration protein [Kitasatospora acidiphila]|uniref:Head decoration protein n=1 Tax=Kitasatospora acidiphila TaxID=2567942 RepID=A0A540W972_9ACTN|nr:head decoration protein [Kitasatospora acidiphila]TQF05538.1 head decoration protein [Kitasatospora acidiphila]
MTIQPVSSSAQFSTDRSWLASLHGTDSTETITLDITKFTAGVHYQVSADTTQPYSRVLSGVPVGKITASGLFGPYDPAATDGRQVLAGLVFAETLFAPTQTKVPAALLWHGVVRVAKVPGGIDPSKITSSVTGPQIRFI